MRPILLAAVVIVSFMALVKDGRMLRSVGVTGSCSAVVAPAGEAGTWERCKPGKLEGAPDLSRQGCTSAASDGNAVYWRCPEEIDSGFGS